MWLGKILKSKNYDKIKCVIFDLDGTIYFGSHLADEANKVIDYVREKFKNVFFITNNSNQTRKQVLDRLLGHNVKAELSEVINTAYACAKYLRENDYKEVYCLGNENLANEISDFGIKIDSKFPQAIVVGYDKTFDLMKLEKALNVFHDECKIIVASKERTYPRTPEIISPGAGPIAAAFEYTVDKAADIVIGKPNPYMLEMMTKELNFQPEEILVVGDCYDIDIKMADNLGALSILICNDENSCYDCTTVKELKDILDIFENSCASL